MPTNIDQTHFPRPASPADDQPTTDAPDPVDLHVGMRLRIRRVILGLDQRSLGAAVGVSFQQIQKYERGHNRISASRLFDLAHALGVPIDYFFGDLAIPRRVDAPAAPDVPATGYSQAESKALVEAFWDLPDAEFRRRVLDLVDVLALNRRR